MPEKIRQKKDRTVRTPLAKVLKMSKYIMTCAAKIGIIMYMCVGGAAWIKDAEGGGLRAGGNSQGAEEREILS